MTEALLASAIPLLLDQAIKKAFEEGRRVSHARSRTIGLATKDFIAVEKGAHRERKPNTKF